MRWPRRGTEGAQRRVWGVLGPPCGDWGVSQREVTTKVKKKNKKQMGFQGIRKRFTSVGKIHDRTGASVWAIQSPSPERVQALRGVADPGAIGEGVFFFPQVMGSAHSSGHRASAPTALTVAGYGPGGTFLCPVWPGLECPGRMAATQAPWGPRRGADQLSPDRQSPIPQTPSSPSGPVLCPGSRSQHRRPGHWSQHCRSPCGCGDRSPPSPRGRLRTRPCPAQRRHRDRSGNVQELTGIFFFLC